jgi:AbrB family looped-hinge helix DNA binding protein
MAEVATTRMSSKGQVVIPEDIRNRLGLDSGVEFIVIGSGDSIILKAISSPPMGEFNALQKAARKAKLSPTDIKEAIKRTRRRH